MVYVKKFFTIFIMIIVLSLVSCSSKAVPVLRVADFNMPKTYFGILDQYDTKEYPKPIVTTTPDREEEETKKRFEPPAGEVKVTFGGTLTEEFTNFEYNINQGGAYIDIIVTGTEWGRDVGSDPKLTQILIDSLQGSITWRRQILPRLNVDNIDRLTGNLLRIRIPVPENFNISTTEQVSLELPSVLLQGVKKNTTIIVRERLYIRNGNGTSEDPFSIQEARDLKALAVYPDKAFRLEKDFDMEGYDWEPFEFSGTLYGNKKTIKNMKIKGNEGSPTGIFSVLTGTVTHLNLVDMIVEGQDDTGAVAGINKGAIQHCFVTGKVVGRNNTGGITGTNDGGAVRKTNAMCAVKGRNNIGGIAGSVTSGMIQGCCSNALVTGFDSTGGIAGRTRYPGKISSCMITGGYIYYSGSSLSTAGRICGNPETNTLFNNAGT
ncbi:MAG TPA: hypothetical protein DDZ89_20715, partial [Clostridiales bacterium]|nr:hypothetical protein [Clostridiales bacterium]